MRPRSAIDWIAVVLLLVGALSWGVFLTGDPLLMDLFQSLWAPLDELLMLAITLAGVYWVYRLITADS
ncbi:hypothetical protein [Halocatena halophila]|uniref:hypothetical protein n=1 Tax=Halocatena halophila TaxID=2814576 RepID=UPI002ED2AEC3